MQARSSSLRYVAGFTLVEMVLVIAITGIIASTLVVFVKPAISGYDAARRRAELTDIADTALRRLARDIRSAVPNSVRTPNDQCFELVPTVAGGRYRMAADTLNDGAGCPGGASCSASLETSRPVTAFDVLSPLATTPQVGDLVVVGNQDTNDVYAGRSAVAISGVAAPPNPLFGQTRLSFASHQFPLGYDGGRFSIVAANGGQPAIAYVCTSPGVDGNGNGTGTLYRLTQAFGATYPGACPSIAGAAIVATRVSNCSFTYNPSVSQQRGLVTMRIELSNAFESVALSHGTHVDNAP